MPVYNGEPFIREALDSLLAQTFTDFELIISDNASTDETEAICREYSSKDERIRYVRQAENLGSVANFQFVLGPAVGEYFIWAAADDSQKPSFIEQLAILLDQNKECCCAMSDVENVFGQPEKKSSISRLDDIRAGYALENWNECRMRFFRNPTSNIFFCIYGLFRLEVLKRVELNYRGLVKYASESEVPFLAQVSLLGPICSIPEPLKIYRRHESSLYHEEQSRLLLRDKVIGFVNVSSVLVRIIADSRLASLEKMRLYATVIITSSKWFGIHLLRKSVKMILGLAG